MVIEQADRNTGFRRDAAHGNSGVAVAAQAAKGGGHQHFTAVIGAGTAILGRVDGHWTLLCGDACWRA